MSCLFRRERLDEGDRHLPRTKQESYSAWKCRYSSEGRRERQGLCSLLVERGLYLSAEDSNNQNIAAATRVDLDASAGIGHVHEKMPQKLQSLLSAGGIRGGFSSRSLCTPGKNKQQEHHAKINTTNTTLTSLTLELVHANLLRERKRVKYDLKYASESADHLTPE